MVTETKRVLCIDKKVNTSSYNNSKYIKQILTKTQDNSPIVRNFDVSPSVIHRTDRGKVTTEIGNLNDTHKTSRLAVVSAFQSVFTKIQSPL